MAESLQLKVHVLLASATFQASFKIQWNHWEKHPVNPLSFLLWDWPYGIIPTRNPSWQWDLAACTLHRWKTRTHCLIQGTRELVSPCCLVWYCCHAWLWWIFSRAFSYFFLCSWNSACQKQTLIENGLFILSQAIWIKFLGCHWLKYLIPNLCLASDFALDLGGRCDPALLDGCGCSLRSQDHEIGVWQSRTEGNEHLHDTQGSWWLFAGRTQRLRVRCLWAVGSAERMCLCGEAAEQERCHDGVGSSGHSNKRSGHS